MSDSTDDSSNAGNAAEALPVSKLGDASRSWPRVLGEIAIIVVGVVIAITLEQLVQEIHWSSEVSNARRALYAETAEANAIFRYRLAAQDCVARRLDALEAATERAAAGQPAPVFGTIQPHIGFALVDSTWQAERASQVLTHFPDDELLGFGAYYYQLSNMQRIIDDEFDAWQIIRILEGDPKRLNAADFSNLRVAMKRARSTNGLIAAIAREQLATAAALKLPVGQIDRDRLKLACAPIAELAASAR
ncbi:MAG: hypothetical protein SFV20_04815 [Sphingopyxis sp.]|nr:hypothetical protein [Sphingopyxis sp.]